MNCPKCGYEQEDRLDCRKCGIVFSKYFAMQAEATASASGTVPQVENGPSGEILELRQSMRDLSRRLLEVEFERVERGQIRNELKGLEKKNQTGLEQLTHRLEELETLLSTPQAPPPIPDGARLSEVQREIVEVNVDPIARRLTEAEERLQRWESEVASLRDSQAGEITSRLEGIFGSLAGRLDAAEEKLQHLDKAMSSSGNSAAAEVPVGFEVRLRELENRIDSLQSGRPSLEAVTGYQELHARVQALSDEFSFTKSSADKLPVLQEGLGDLRAEIGMLRSKIQSLEGDITPMPAQAAEPPADDRLESEIRSIREGIQEIRDFISRVAAKP